MKQKIPENIKTAVDGLLAPFGLSTQNLENTPPVKEEEKVFLSVQAAEKYSSLSRWTLGRAIKEGALKAFKLSKAKCGKVLIKRTDLDNWIKSHCLKSSY
jgi:hypothetical protein